MAEANNVDVQKVIDAIVAEMNEHLAQAVTDGRLTQAEADERKANATERATALVNGERPERPDGPPAFLTSRTTGHGASLARTVTPLP